MAVGDIDSNDRGTGARFNDGKLPMQLVPVRYWLARWSVSLPAELFLPLTALQEFEEGRKFAIGDWIADECPNAWMVEAVRVFDYGQGKYKAWNWAKGMAWSIPIGCILRHAKSMYEGEETDPESNLPHIGHIVCNLIMLDWFVRGYPEGNDLPPPNVTDG